MKKTTLSSFVALLVLAASVLAVAPQKWTFRGVDDFLRGMFDGISVSSDGVLTLAPREDKIVGPSEDFYLSFLMTPEGVAYLGTGHEGKIYKIGKDGKSELYIQLPEMDVTCLAMDVKGVLYAGTSPNGKIYRIAGQGKNTEFFDPSEKYIWSLAIQESGGLLAAVGENGGIYEITPMGEGRQIFKAKENHVLCMKFDRNKDIVAGTGGGGLVYRIGRTGKTAVIFESPFEEVRSLAFDLEGTIYAAAGGTPIRSRRDELALPAAGRETDVQITVSAVPQAKSPAPTKTPVAPASGSREPGALFRISPDGVAKSLWMSADEMIYSLFWNESEKKVYFGTGPKGRIFVLDKEEKSTLILQKNSEQIYDLTPVGVRTYVLANNPAQISLIAPEQRLAGEYLGPVLDAKIVASWGRIGWGAELPQGTTLQVQTRSGNSYEPGPSWSDWSPPYQKMDGEQILSPKGRYVQFRALFKAQSGRLTPALSRLSAYYLQTNVAPVINRLEVMPPNEVYLKPMDQDESIWALEKRGPEPAAKKDEALRFAMAKKVERKGFQTVVWDAADDNGDTLLYSISIKQDGDAVWRTIEDGWTETLLTFNTQNFPDGVYVLKVTASDLASNPPDFEKKGEKTSPSLVIDNTPPVLNPVQAVRAGRELNVSFQAEDALSAIKEAKYLVRPDVWRIATPEDGICDSKAESFKFKVALLAGADSLITIIVKDAAGNTLTFKQPF